MEQDKSPSKLIFPSPSMSISPIIPLISSSVILAPMFVITVLSSCALMYPLLSASKARNASVNSASLSVCRICLDITKTKSSNDISPFPVNQVKIQVSGYFFFFLLKTVSIQDKRMILKLIFFLKNYFLM